MRANVALSALVSLYHKFVKWVLGRPTSQTGKLRLRSICRVTPAISNLGLTDSRASNPLLLHCSLEDLFLEAGALGKAEPLPGLEWIVFGLHGRV